LGYPANRTVQKRKIIKLADYVKKIGFVTRRCVDLFAVQILKFGLSQIAGGQGSHDFISRIRHRIQL
jgi:hypothetical protein